MSEINKYNDLTQWLKIADRYLLMNDKDIKGWVERHTKVKIVNVPPKKYLEKELSKAERDIVGYRNSVAYLEHCINKIKGDLKLINNGTKSKVIKVIKREVIVDTEKEKRREQYLKLKKEFESNE